MMRIGKITYDRFLLKDNLLELHKVFAYLEFIPVRCEHVFHMAGFEAVGISPHFDDIETGEMIPEYSFIKELAGSDGKVRITKIKAMRGVDSTEELGL